MLLKFDTLFFESFSTERYIRTSYANVQRDYTSICTAGPFVCPSIPIINQMLVEMATIYPSVLQFSLAPRVFLYFGSHFRIVIFICRNRFQDTMLYMAAAAKQPRPVSSTSPVGLFLLSEHASPTCVTPLLISCQKFVWSSARLVYAAFISTCDVTTDIL